MNDRELLELAAKAAGIELLRSRLDNPVCADFLLKDLADGGYAIGWNPLTNDGDALRLAVKLRFRISTPTAGVRFGQRAIAESQDRERGVLLNCGDEWGDEALDRTDPLAATRRAIVRAAAEIGRMMP